MAPLGLDGVHTETLLAAGYAVLLLVVAFGIERMAHRSHRRAEAYATSGFIYHAHLDAWECPTGQHLQPIHVDELRRMTRYRASAAACNRCPLKTGCTDSESGREVTRTHDPWLETEIGRFHRGLSFVLALLGGLILTLTVVRNHDDADVLVLGPTLLVVLFALRQRISVLRPSAPAGDALRDSAARLD
jgi:hypothetical protein